MDETLPLLSEQQSYVVSESPDSPPPNKDLVDFDPQGDGENPLEWRRGYKWAIVALLALMAFTVTFTCISVVPVANRIVRDLDHGRSSKSASVLLVTIWELGEAGGPLLIAPLSEIFGRYPVMNVCNMLFIAATVLAALSESTALFIAARALTGLAVAGNVLNPAIVGDMFISEQRGSALSIIQPAPLLGGAVGPAIAGAVAEGLGWRQVVWMSVALAIVCETLFLICFRETYQVPILKQKAARLRRETGNQALQTVFDAGNGQSGAKKLWDAIKRPAVVLAGSGVLQALSLYGSVVFTYFYIMSTSLPDILENIYHLSATDAGACFISFSVGSSISVVICNLTLDRIYVRMREARKGPGRPEYRLPLTIVGTFTLPIAIAMYGWAAQLQAPLPTLLACVGLIGFTMMLAFLPLFAYVVDSFGLYSASALTAVIVTRCLMGTFLPLSTEPLVDRLGYGWGITVLGVLCLALAPIPVLLFQHGYEWRQLSAYTKEQ